MQVSFTDDAGNEETLTSAATDAVTAAPASNTPATGQPTISGTAQVGETLTADTSGIADTDGLTTATLSYQWLADDADIAGATGSAYTLADADEGKAIKVQVSFTDDAGNDETLTSAATDAVATAEPSGPPARPTGLTAEVSHDRVVLTWDDPNDDGITGYVILRRNRDTDARGPVHRAGESDTGTAATTYTDDTVAAETPYTYRIKAINAHGSSERSRWFHIDTLAHGQSPPRSRRLNRRLSRRASRRGTRTCPTTTPPPAGSRSEARPPAPSGPRAIRTGSRWSWWQGGPTSST